MSIVIPRLRPLAAEFAFFFFKAFSLFLRSLIGGDDVLHEAMTNNVFFTEVDKLNAVDITKNLLRLFQAGAGACGQIDLRNIACNHGLRAVAQPREEHFHLFRRRILRFI
jgi:hypothetical protein